MDRISLSANGFLHLGVLISGRGSNLQALIRATVEKGFPAKISVVISNKPDAPGLKVAEDAGIPTFVVDHKKHPDKKPFEEEIDSVLRAHNVSLVCLAGFMRILSPWLIERWPMRLVNIHPSLLPDFKGLHPQRQALEAGVHKSGCTVHFVTPETDSGPAILQGEVPVLDADTEETLSARILETEHRIYPQAIRLLASHDFHIESGGKIVWCEKIAQPKPARYS